jgi:hypothetical protein
MRYLREVFESGCTQIFGEEILITVVIQVPCLRDAVRQGIPYGLREVSIVEAFFMRICAKYLKAAAHNFWRRDLDHGGDTGSLPA